MSDMKHKKERSTQVLENTHSSEDWVLRQVTMNKAMEGLPGTYDESCFPQNLQ